MALSISVTALGIGVLTISNFLSLFSAPCLAASSIASFPSVPIWALTQASVQPFTRHSRFSTASAVLRAIIDLKMMLSRVSRAAWGSVYIFFTFFKKAPAFEARETSCQKEGPL